MHEVDMAPRGLDWNGPQKLGHRQHGHLCHVGLAHERFHYVHVALDGLAQLRHGKVQQALRHQGGPRFCQGQEPLWQLVQPSRHLEA